VGVAGLWAIAWAGTKPVASLLDGWLAGHIGIWLTSVVLAFAAMVLALCELMIPQTVKRRIKGWSLADALGSSFLKPVLINFNLLRLERLSEEESVTAFRLPKLTS
jgi:hypothetical protein